jgi:GTP-binding protein
MFVDEVSMLVRSGAGGDGIVAWLHEKRQPRGGPGGGDGGRGGSVVFVVDSELTTFSDMEAARVVRAEDGARGGSNRRHGRSGADRELRVPPGTTVYDARTGRRLVDLATPGERWVAARGGRGGRGNCHFASATDQRPLHAENGQPARERRLRLELRLLADVGLVGLPNAGKSTLLSRWSSARPRIADYPFTTLEPYLGIVERPDFGRFVLADLPGLIQGAHAGAGLGDRFLRHVERTRVLLHLVDLAPIDGSDPGANYALIRSELEAYGRGLSERPEVVAATKVDAVPEPARGEALRRLAAVVDRAVYPISAVTGEGLAVLLGALDEALGRAAPPPEVPGACPGEDGDGDRDEGGDDAAGCPGALPGDGAAPVLGPDPEDG